MITAIILEAIYNPEYNTAAALLWSLLGFLLGALGMDEYCRLHHYRKKKRIHK